ncbi:aconitate hydratase [Celerinatantimonas diazotrophica]|uniref:Aconitate hydratase n=2 Tax=Celerinatantimonas diazotrophica TaxID=412034 RepID=A0A4R1K282_9GAMM|nr:aconitate hydratase [Celerinatantimonas diazotrophica]CAG9297813.1 Aconitate hydratase A [Celerinatantimonas diazotrophica]
MNSFNTQTTLDVGGQSYTIYRLDRLPQWEQVRKLPYCLKVLLENLLRKEDGHLVHPQDIQAIIDWQPDEKSTAQISFTPGRVILQDFTGVPAVVDLAAMRDAIVKLGGDPEQINPLEMVDLVIDHSVMVDYFASTSALSKNIELEFKRNQERYQFLRWGQQAFSNFRVVPPGTGIVHQVNLEYLAQCVISKTENGQTFIYPDTLVGTDSHTTMVNGLGVLGWGVGGIEAEAAMLGQPVSMLLPQVVGFELTGELKEGATATDLVLTVTQMLRERGVVGKFVEFFGDGLAHLPLADRATIANMAPEYGATCGIFPIDAQTIEYLHLSGREEKQIQLIETYAKAQGLWREQGDAPAQYSANPLHLDLSTVEPSLAGPKRPQDRVPLSQAHTAFEEQLSLYGQSQARFNSEGGTSGDEQVGSTNLHDPNRPLQHGDVVIAAITSCTNTSNPAVMIAAGLVAKKAAALGLKTKPWVKTSLAPGSQVVPAYLDKAGLTEPLNQLGYEVVGFGCTTCIGNSGPLPESISQAIAKDELVVASVLSGNRNFEGRIHSDVKMNYLASPPLVVAYALAGSMSIDLYNEPLAMTEQGQAVYLKDIWPTQQEVAELISQCIDADLYRNYYEDVFKGSQQWQNLPTPTSQTYTWPDSTYVKNPPYFEGMTQELPSLKEIVDARCLVKVGDSITTDHISPAGSIKADSPAGKYLISQNVDPKDFNSLGSRRGNHEVMMRGTFANVRLKNQLAPGTEGSFTCYFPTAEITDIYSAAMKYKQDKTPLIVLAGKEYGTGSSRDWAAKGPKLLGVEVVIAQSYERIHRSNLVGFGILPLQFKEGESADTLGLNGDELFTFEAIEGSPKTLTVTAKSQDSGQTTQFDVQVRIDTPAEWHYYRHGGILHYVLRNLTH